MPVQASVRSCPWRWGSQITTYVICMPSFVRAMCAFEYASTKVEYVTLEKEMESKEGELDKARFGPSPVEL